MTDKKTQRSFFNRIWAAVRTKPTAMPKDHGRDIPHPANRQRPRSAEAGNVFFTLFGAVAVVGVLGAGIMSTMRGPLSTMVEVNRIEETKAKMRLNARMIILDVDQNGPFGTCGGDDIANGGTLEFAEARAFKTGSPNPANGGQIPDDIGGQKNDAWGTPYGYCVWDNGADDSGCQSNMLTGENNPNAVAIALVSAGPDRTFNTSCGQAKDDKAQNDDIVEPLTYADAVAAAGGGGGSYWSENTSNSTIESSAPIEVGGDSTTTSTFGGGASFGNNLLTTGKVITNTVESTSGPSGTVDINSDMTGDALTLSETLTVTGITTLNGATTVNNTLTVSGTNATTLGGTLDVSGNFTGGTDDIVTIDDGLNVTGDGDFDAALNIDGNLTGGTDDVVNIDDALDITGVLTGGSDDLLTIDDSLTITGSLNGDITVNSVGTDATTDAWTITNNNGTGTEIFAVDNAGNISFAGDLQITGATDAQILISDGSSNFTPQDMTGDVKIANNGETTIQPLAIENGMIADDAITNVKIEDDTITGAKLNFGSGSNGNCVKLDGDVIYSEACSDGGGGDGVGITATDADNCLMSYEVSSGNYGWQEVSCDSLNASEANRIVDSTTPNPDTYIDVDTDGTGDLNTIVFYTNGAEQASLSASGIFVAGDIRGDNHRIGGLGVDYYENNSPAIYAAEGGSVVNFADDIRFITGSSATISARSSIGDDLTISHLNEGRDITFLTAPVSDNTSVEAMRIDALGNVGIGTLGEPNQYALLELASTTRGFLAPRMSAAERDSADDSFTPTEAGMMIFNTDAGTSGLYQFWDGDEWIDIGGGGADGVGLWTPSDDGDYIEYEDTYGGMRVGRISGLGAPASDWLLDSANSVVFTTTNKVGIGTSAIDSGLILDLAGAIGATQYCDAAGENCFSHTDVLGSTGLWTEGTGSEIYYDSANVGIGTTDPATLLDAQGTLRLGSGGEDCETAIEGAMRFNTTNDTFEICVDDGDWSPLATGDGSLWSEGAEGSEIYYSADNVGIGTNNPYSLLHVSSESSGDAVITITADQSDSNESYNPWIEFVQDGGTVTGNLGLVGTSSTAFNKIVTDTIADSLLLGTGSASSAIQFATDDAVHMTMLPTGEIGMGTTSPTEKLEVTGKIKVSESLILEPIGSLSAPVNPSAGASAAGSDGQIQYNSGGSALGASADLYWDSANSYLGIGTDEPDTALNVIGQISIDNDTSGTPGCIQFDGTELQFSHDCSTDWTTFGGGGSSVWKAGTGSEIYYDTANVGIGTTTDPGVSLDVGGSFRIGDGGETCGPTYQGTLRFLSTDNELQMCNGSDWVTIASTTGASGGGCTDSQSYNTPGEYTFTVDGDNFGCTFRIKVYGAPGGGSGGGGGGAAQFDFTPASMGEFKILVGGQGLDNEGGTAIGGGGGGDGNGSGDGGGGASAVAYDDGSITVLSISGGGGGGGSSMNSGGDGGSLNACGGAGASEAGDFGYGGCNNSGGSGGGSYDGGSGGSDGAGSSRGGDGYPAFLVSGGGGGATSSNSGAGGGGYGGGEGGNYGHGGGGGGGYLNSAAVDNEISLTRRGRDVDGLVEIVGISGTPAVPAGTKLNDLADTAVPAPTDGVLLKYDNATSKWIATTNLIEDSSGNIGINDPSPTVELSVDGDIQYTGTLTDISDRRLKTNIQELDTQDMLGKIMQVGTYSFHMKDQPDGPVEFGVMAQELETLFPNLVRTSSDERQTKSVNYIGLIAPLIKTTQQLNTENIALKTQLEDLKAKQSKTLASLEKIQSDIHGLKAHTGYGISKAGYTYIFIFGVAFLLINTAFWYGRRPSIRSKR